MIGARILLLLDSPGLLVGLEVFWLFLMAGWILQERRPPVTTLAWILGLALLPVVGVPVYLFFGPHRLKRRLLRRAAARQNLPGKREAWETLEAEAPLPTRQLLQLARTLTGVPAETATTVTLYDDGDQTIDAIVEAIAAARDHVHLEYYIFSPDRSGTRVLQALEERARAGVTVRLLVDASGSSNLKPRFLAPLLEAGGQVARFNPAFGGKASARFFNFRTHRKIVVCDGLNAFTGGVNVTDSHSSLASGQAAWRDTHLRLTGNAVHGLQLAFLEDWLFSRPGEPAPESDALRARYFPEAERGIHLVQIVASGPDEPGPRQSRLEETGHAVEALYFAAIAGARRRIWLTTPYLLPSEPMAAALESAALRGVDVRLLVPLRTDSRLVDAASRTFHGGLLAAGAAIHLYGPPMVHAKTCVVDDDLAIVGTANIDNRSLRLNFEVVAAIHGGPAVEELAAFFQRDLERARPSERGGQRERFPGRLFSSLARLLTPQL
jgi:cardiolipin synthase A/B